MLVREAKNDFDLLVTDLIIPLLTGVDLCAQVKAIRPDMSLILCSGDSGQITEELLQRVGIDEYFLKPVTLLGLAQIVRRALDRKRARGSAAFASV